MFSMVIITLNSQFSTLNSQFSIFKANHNSQL